MTQTIEAWHRVVATRDPKALDALLDENVVFHSPVVHTPQEGKKITTVYLTAAIAVFGNPSFRYVREIVGERDALLEFTVDVGGIHVNGVDIIRWNDEGKIIDFKVLLRPLKAVNLMHQMMGAALKNNQGNSDLRSS